MYIQSNKLRLPALASLLAMVAVVAGPCALAQQSRSVDAQVELIGVSPLDQGTNPFDQADLRREFNNSGGPSGGSSEGAEPAGEVTPEPLNLAGALPTATAYPPNALISVEIDAGASTLAARSRTGAGGESSLLLEPRADLGGKAWVSAAAGWSVVSGPTGAVATGSRTWVLRGQGGEHFALSATFNLDGDGGLTVTALGGFACGTSAGGCP